MSTLSVLNTCTQCHLLGYRQKFCTGQGHKAPTQDEDYINCRSYNEKIITHNLKKFRLRVTNYKTNASVCKTKQALINKIQKTRILDSTDTKDEEGSFSDVVSILSADDDANSLEISE